MADGLTSTGRDGTLTHYNWMELFGTGLLLLGIGPRLQELQPGCHRWPPHLGTGFHGPIEALHGARRTPTRRDGTAAPAARTGAVRGPARTDPHGQGRDILSGLVFGPTVDRPPRVGTGLLLTCTIVTVQGGFYCSLCGCEGFFLDLARLCMWCTAAGVELLEGSSRPCCVRSRWGLLPRHKWCGLRQSGLAQPGCGSLRAGLSFVHGAERDLARFVGPVGGPCCGRDAPRRPGR